jgi:hypothetical protein
LRTKLTQAEKPELLAKLQAAIAALDPEMLKMPEWEREIPGARPTNREPRRQAPPVPPK